MSDRYRLEINLPYETNRELERLRIELTHQLGKKCTKSDIVRVIIEACIDRLKKGK